MRTLCLTALIATALSTSAGLTGPTTFYTAKGTGPDKWASVWLLERHMNPPVRVHIVSREELADLDPADVIDEPMGQFRRSGSKTTFASLAEHFTPGSQQPHALGTLIHEIEIDAWRDTVSLESRFVEQGFRSMQIRYGRSAVSKACYLDFFDAVYTQIKNDSWAELESPDQLVPHPDCLNSKSHTATSGHGVSTLPLERVLQLVAEESEPIFVDTREAWEFDEGHIPGAVNLTVRDINQESVAQFRGQRTVIAYCVKDFRGYEAARKLRQHGINAFIMTPHGLRGWIDNELPVAGPRGLPEPDALDKLKSIAVHSAKIAG